MPPSSPQIVTFSQALQEADDNKRYLLLGNGFSIEILPDIFRYKRLYEEADFTEFPELENAFTELATYDFEQVIRSLLVTPKIVSVYRQYTADSDRLTQKIQSDAEKLKDILVSTIAQKHPNRFYDVDEKRYVACKRFLANFNKTYTLNYDLLLYWSLLNEDLTNPLQIDDGFRLADLEFGEGYRIFDSPHSPTFFFLHGALHIFDAGTEVRKYTWSDTGIPIMDQVRGALDQGMFPVFVSEGEWQEKLTKINHSAYLSKALRSFEAICNMRSAELFIFGHSLDDNDSHILEKINNGLVKKIFVSVFNDPEHGYDQTVIDKALRLGSERSRNNRPTIKLFDAASANVWGLR